MADEGCRTLPNDESVEDLGETQIYESQECSYDHGDDYHKDGETGGLLAGWPRNLPEFVDDLTDTLDEATSSGLTL